jgi:hypothetical protein
VRISVDQQNIPGRALCDAFDIALWITTDAVDYDYLTVEFRRVAPGISAQGVQQATQTHPAHD